MAESDRIADKARFTSADGSPIAKTVDDEWRDGPGAVFVGSTPTAETGPALEKFVAAHPDFLPARMSLGRYYQSLGDAIKDPGAKSVATRTRHFEAANVQLTRAVGLAANPTDAAQAFGDRIGLLGPNRLNRPAEAETLARSAIAKYPDQPMLMSGRRHSTSWGRTCGTSSRETRICPGRSQRNSWVTQRRRSTQR